MTGGRAGAGGGVRYALVRLRKTRGRSRGICALSETCKNAEEGWPRKTLATLGLASPPLPSLRIKQRVRGRVLQRRISFGRISRTGVRWPRPSRKHPRLCCCQPDACCSRWRRASRDKTVLLCKSNEISSRLRPWVRLRRLRCGAQVCSIRRGPLEWQFTKWLCRCPARRWEVGPRRRGLEVIVESLFIHQASANGRAVLLSLLADARLRTTLPNRGIEVASLRIFLQALILLTRSARSSIESIRHARAGVFASDRRERHELDGMQPMTTSWILRIL